LPRERMMEEAGVASTEGPEGKGVNPPIFDFVLKRSLAWGGARLPSAVFETRGFFDPAPGRA
jgi:hypothetical protein